MLDDELPLSFSEREEKILSLWKENSVFEKSLKQRENQPIFSFYDGPPFATGLPHYGHLLAGTIKDVVPRYKTMKGFQVPRRFGWDCHGLPVEQEIEKSHQLSGAAAIEEFGIGAFNEACRSIVQRYTKEWEHTVNRMGRWVSFEQTYRTMDITFMESVWAVFKAIYDKGLVYEGYKVMPFSAKLGTPLSNFEAGENYKEVDDPAITVKFKIRGKENTFILAWTTTPWTLPSNLALCVENNITYAEILDHKSGEHLILAETRLSSYYKNPEDYVVVKTWKGSELVGLHYEPLFPYFAHYDAFRVISGDFVTEGNGTGIVHTAPAFGENDFYACQKEGIKIACPVDQNGHFTAEIPEYAGRFVKEADADIIRSLKQKGLVFHHGVIRHSYPFCWRSDTPLIYRAMTTWFVAVEKIKSKMLSANSQINWMPEHIKEGRFGKWLENARDWAISRNRYWGTPIPIWRAEDGEIKVIGSIQELESLTGEKITDLHRHYVDQLTFTYQGKTFKRVKEVFDCWFESGSMPYAQLHYPFENKELFEKTFPADFIAEGLDQTRGWFYTLTVLAAALHDRPPFKNVIVNGIILAEDGNKMSKRLKNYPDPHDVISKYGADAVRLYMLHSPAVRADDLRFSERGVELVLRQFLIPLWSSYNGFFLTYAKIYNWKPENIESFKPQAMIDRWILSLVQKLVLDVQEAMDRYDLQAAVQPFTVFVEQLTNWYIRRSRRRFWEAQDTPDRREAFSTLYCILMNLVKIAAPFIPFITESIYQNLRMAHEPESVHLCDYPAYCEEMRDIELEKSMALVQQVVSLGHGLRKEHKVKVRQPLSTVTIISKNKDLLETLQQQQHLILDELNVKSAEFTVEEENYVSLVPKPNFRILGKKVGKMMKAVQEHIAKLSYEMLLTLQKGNAITIEVEGESIALTQEDVAVERIIKSGMAAYNEGELTVLLDLSITESLAAEGMARELVNKINTMRKENDFAVTDHIELTIQTASKMLESSFRLYETYIKEEVLAVSTECFLMEKINLEKCIELNGEYAQITIVRLPS